MLLLDEHSPAHIRKAFGVTQAEMASAMGLSLRGYEELEGGRTTLRKIHRLAAYAAAMSMALDDPKKIKALPPDLADTIIALTKMIIDQPDNDQKR